MSTKKAVDQDASADRPSRQAPTHREPVQYNVVPGHGATDIDYTKDQTVRSHEEAKDSEAKTQGAIACDEDRLDNAKRRFAAIHQRRKETEQAFDALRPTVAGTRKRLGR